MKVDLVLFFRDPLKADTGNSSEQNLLRLCDMHSVPIATNIATAEVLLRGLDQGDLDYRDGDAPGNSGAHFRPLVPCAEKLRLWTFDLFVYRGYKNSAAERTKTLRRCFSITELTVGTACPALWILSGSVLTFPGQPSV